MNGNREPAFWPWLFTLGVCCGVVGYFVAQEDHVTAFALTAIVLFALRGYRKKASRLASLFCGLAAAALLAPPLGLFCEPQFAYLFGTSGAANRVLIALVVGL